MLSNVCSTKKVAKPLLSESLPPWDPGDYLAVYVQMTGYCPTKQILQLGRNRRSYYPLEWELHDGKFAR